MANLNGLLGAGNYFAYAASYSHDYSKNVCSISTLHPLLRSQAVSIPWCTSPISHVQGHTATPTSGCFASHAVQTTVREQAGVLPYVASLPTMSRRCCAPFVDS